MGLTGSYLTPAPLEVPPHWLHADERLPWGVSNCYVDLWIEVLHWLQLEPLAALTFCIAADHRGDQWTFLKPPHADLRQLYGIEVSELAVSHSLPEHIAFHLSHGELLITEADAFYLPDTTATTYRKRHQKTTIAVTDLDVDGRRMRYFHDRGFHALGPEDFEGVFGPRTGLPPYLEAVQLDDIRRAGDEELAETAARLMRDHLGRRPHTSPFSRWGQTLASDLQRIAQRGEAGFHVYAFTHVRQAGAAFQYAAAAAEWIALRLNLDLADAVHDLRDISARLKRLMLRIARAVAGRRNLEVDDDLAGLTTLWERAMATLEHQLGRLVGVQALP